ncbi:MAG TPA: hypothetical protein VGU45_05010 [Microvirga sp.]|jgi:hypothetical protein|nr:hypothetical protein [Microvirga sp.]
MGFFPQTVAAKLSGRTIGVSLLCFMDFREQPRRWWTGFGTLVTGGHEWLGTGEVVSIDGLEQPIGTAAPKTTFTLSGVDPDLVRMARLASNRVKDRRVTVYLQFFDVVPDDAGVQPWTPLDEPYAVWAGIMDQLTYNADGPSSRSITLTAESLWVNRRRPPFGLYTDSDQKARFPGDRGLEQVAALVTKTIRWPVF